MTLLPLLILFGFGIAAAVLTISQRNPIHSALFLILTLVSVATSFLMLRADFLAMIQIILYAGAIMVLIIFVLLLTARTELNKESLFHRQSPFAFLIGAGLALEIFYILSRRMPHPSPSASPHSLTQLGELLFKKYLIPFELASVLLLVSLVATVAIAKKEETP